MFITIAGGGRIGRELAHRLGEGKHDLVIIDSDRSVCETIYSEYGAVTINGNATDLKVLENAGIERSDVAIAAMRDDSANLMFALLAHHLKIPNIHVRMTDPKYEPLYKNVGVTNIGRVSDLLVEQFIVNIETPDLRKVVGIGTLEIGIVNVPEDSICSGTAVKDLVVDRGFPKNVLITCLFQGDTEEFVVPHGNTVITTGDRLFVCGTRSDIRVVAKLVRTT